MKQLTNLLSAKVTFVLLVTLLIACDQQKEAPPFPHAESEFEQPNVRALMMPEPEPFTWNTWDESQIKVSPKVKFDLKKIPAKPFNIEVPYPLTEPWDKEKFDWSTLPVSDFSLDSLPSEKVSFVIRELGDPKQVKAGNMVTTSTTSRGVMTIDSNFGLPGTSNVSLKDRNGFLWFGTSNGLVRYDGANLEIYGSEQGLNAVNISDLFEDSKGRLWVLNGTDQMSVIDFEAKLIHDMRSDLNQSNRHGMMEADDGTFWYSAVNYGYFIFDFETKTLRNFNQDHGLLGGFNVVPFQDEQGLIWLTSNSGVNIIDPQKKKQWQFTQKEGLLANFTGSVFQDDNKDIWITGGNGITILNQDKTEVSYFKTENYLNGTWPITKVFKGSEGMYWLGTANGFLFSFDKVNGLLRKHVLAGTRSNWVYKIIEDDHGVIWASIAQNGLFKLDRSLGMPANLDRDDGLSSDDMWATLEDHKGKMWIGSRDGIDIYDPEDKTIRQLTEAEGLFNNSNTRLNTDSRGRIWANGITEGVSIIDPEEQTIQKLTTADNLLEGMLISFIEIADGRYWLGTNEGEILSVDLKNNIYKSIVLDSTDINADNNSLVKDMNGRVWVATLDSGIEVYDLENNTYSRLGTGTGLISDRVYSLTKDASNHIWAGGHDGVSRIDLEKMEVTNFTTSEGLGANDVYAVKEHKEEVYLGTSNGLTVLTPVKKEENDPPLWLAKTLGVNQGLNLVDFAENSFTFDKDERFWGSLVESLTVIDPVAKDSTPFPTYISGINILDKRRHFKDVETISKRRESLDSIWNKEKNDFVSVDRSGKDSSYLTANHIEWESVEGPYEKPVGLQLPHTQNYLSFDYVGLQYSNPDKVVYRYILEGIDNNWSSISASSTSENYRELPPGEYIFKVASRGFNGIWSKPAELRFTILPPWWQTWWAYSILVVLFLGLGLVILHYRSRWLKKENKLLEDKVNERTAALKKTINELENTQSQLIQSEKMASLGELTAGIAHEIQNPMNFINNFAEVSNELMGEMCEELDKGDLEEAKDISKDIVQNLEKISHHGKRASSIVRGMLEHSRNSSGQMEAVDINLLADEYLRLAYHGLRAKDKSFNANFETDLDSSLPKVPIIPQDLGRVVLNLINNAFYAVTSIPEDQRDKNYTPLVTVSTKNLKDQVLISIKDNGPGIPDDIKDKIFQPFFTTKPTGKGTGLGLSLAYDIITTGHGGAIKLETKPGSGTEFLIYIPMKQA